MLNSSLQILATRVEAYREGEAAKKPFDTFVPPFRAVRAVVFCDVKERNWAKALKQMSRAIV